MAAVTVSRLDYGYFVRPAAETGTGSARVELEPAEVVFAHDHSSWRPG